MTLYELHDSISTIPCCDMIWCNYLAGDTTIYCYVTESYPSGLQIGVLICFFKAIQTSKLSKGIY